MPDQRPNTDTLLRTFVTFYRDDSSAPYEWDAMWREKKTATNDYFIYYYCCEETWMTLFVCCMAVVWIRDECKPHISSQRWLLIRIYHLNVFLFCFFFSIVIENKNRTKHSELTHATYTLTLNPKKRCSKNEKSRSPESLWMWEYSDHYRLPPSHCH